MDVASGTVHADRLEVWILEAHDREPSASKRQPSAGILEAVHAGNLSPSASKRPVVKPSPGTSKLTPGSSKPFPLAPDLDMDVDMDMMVTTSTWTSTWTWTWW